MKQLKDAKLERGKVILKATNGKCNTLQLSEIHEFYFRKRPNPSKNFLGKIGGLILEFITGSLLTSNNLYRGKDDLVVKTRNGKALEYSFDNSDNKLLKKLNEILVMVAQQWNKK